MNNHNGYAIDPALEDDLDSVVADDESSNISLSQIELPSSDPITEATETRSSESSVITLSSLSFPSTEHSSAEETCIEKQDLLQISEISQKDVLKKETEKDVLDQGVSEDAINPAGVTEQNISFLEVSSTPKKRKLEESPNRKTGLEKKNISGETSEYKFKKIKQEDTSIKMSSEASHSSNLTSESKSLEDKVLPSAFVEGSLKEQKGTHSIVEDISTDIREENPKHSNEESNLERTVSTSFESAEVSTSSKERKTEKRKLSSPESPDSNIKIQKLASSESEGSLEKDSIRNVDATKSLESPIIELNVRQSKQYEGVIQTADELDFNIKKTSKETYDKNAPESSEMSDYSLETTSVTGSVSSPDDHINIELSKLSPAVLDENAMLSTPEKSEKFFKSQTSEQCKGKIQLQDVKLSITACIKKINLESIENIDKYAESSKNALSNILDSENISADTDNSALREESESDSVLSNDQELIGQPSETSVETLEQQMIKKSRESPALIDEDAMITPPDTIQAAKVDNHNLDAPTSSKVETSLIREVKNDENLDFSCIKKSLNIDEVKSERSSNSSECIESSSKEISIPPENITEKSLEESFNNPKELIVAEDTTSSRKFKEECMIESKLSEISNQNLPKFSEMSSEKSTSRKFHKATQTTNEFNYSEDTSSIEKSSPLSEVSRKELSETSQICTSQSGKLSDYCKDTHEPSSSENPRKTDLPGTSQELKYKEESEDNSETRNIEKDVLFVTSKLFESVLEGHEEKEITPIEISNPVEEKNIIPEQSESLEQNILEDNNSSESRKPDAEQEQNESSDEFRKDDTDT